MVQGKPRRSTPTARAQRDSAARFHHLPPSGCPQAYTGARRHFGGPLLRPGKSTALRVTSAQRVTLPSR